jgi:transposase-like protein
MVGSKRLVEREEFWRAVLDRQRRSGRSVRKFCQQESLSEPAFYAWRRKLQQRAAESVAVGSGNRGGRDESRLIPVAIVPATRQSGLLSERDSNLALEIGTPGGFRLRFAQDTPPETIARLLDVIARSSSWGGASC